MGRREDAPELTVASVKALQQEVFVVEHGLTPGGQVPTADAWNAFLDFAARPVVDRGEPPLNEWTTVSRGGVDVPEHGQQLPSIALDRLIDVHDEDGEHDGTIRCVCNLTFDDPQAVRIDRTFDLDGPAGTTLPSWTAECHETNEFMTLDELAAAAMASEAGPLLRLPMCKLELDAWFA